LASIVKQILIKTKWR